MAAWRSHVPGATRSSTQRQWRTLRHCYRLVHWTRRLSDIESLRRFFPYFHFLNPVRRPLIGAILCALVYGAATGAGLPLMAKEVFPRIFGSDAPALDKWQLIGIALWLPFVFTLRGVAGYFNSRSE